MSGDLTSEGKTFTEALRGISTAVMPIAKNTVMVNSKGPAHPLSRS